jgi:hypothetical protein
LITPEGAVSLLAALSDISDDLEYFPGLEDHELRAATGLLDIIIEKLASEDSREAIKLSIVSSNSLTLALTLIQKLRDAADCTFAQGHRSTRHTPRFEPTEIEQLSEKILPNLERRFSSGLFMKEDYEPYRAYQMANSLGPGRTEGILRQASEGVGTDRVWHLINGIALSIMPEISIESWQHDPSTSVAGTSLLTRLKRFASVPYWKSFLEADYDRPTTKFEAFWLPHLLAAIEKDQSPPPSEEEPSSPQP